MALTPLESLKIKINESQYPVFTDEELTDLLEDNEGNVLLTAYKCCLMKANNESKIKVGSIEIENSSDPSYWNNLAAMYLSEYNKTQSGTSLGGYKTSMRRADGC